MEKLNARGTVPVRDDAYKLLVHNVFSLQELGTIAGSLGASLVSMLRNPLANKMKPQMEILSSAIGKILLAMPDKMKADMLHMFKEQMGLTFNLKEVQQKEISQGGSIDGIQH